MSSEDDLMAAICMAAQGDGQTEIIEALIRFRERLEVEKKRQAFYKAFAECQAEIPSVIKNRSNDQTRSRYADLAAIERAAMPVITKHGFSVRFSPSKSEIEGCYGVKCTVSHESGYAEEYSADIPADMAGVKGVRNKTLTHAFGSTMSYGRRYLLCMVFNIATNDDDDGNAAETITEEQFIALKGRIEEAGADPDKVCKAYKAPSLPEFPARHFDRVMSQLARKMENG